MSLVTLKSDKATFSSQWRKEQMAVMTLQALVKHLPAPMPVVMVVLVKELQSGGAI